MDTSRDRYDELCRLCASYDAVKMDIFGQEGKNRQLVDKIQTCLPFKIAEDDRLPKCLCYRCMYNLENFYDFRTACVNAVALLERCLPPDRQAQPQIKQEQTEDAEPYSELRMELLKEKETTPMLIPEAPVVNPNAALGTPPRLRSEDGEQDGEGLPQDNSGERLEDNDDRKSDDYDMEVEMNPSDFLEMSAMVPEEENHGLPQPSAQDTGVFQHRNEQHEVYVCSLCNKAFSSKGHLSLHARIHVGAGDVIGEKVITDDHTSYKRPYQCDLCNKSYSTAKHRWGHVSTTHRGHPAVTCGYCSRIYSTRTNLEEHIKSRHAGLPPPPETPVPYVQPDSRFQCKTCPKMYTNITDLNKHSRVCQGDQRKDFANNSFNAHSFGSKLKNALEPNSDMSSVDSDYENRDYKSAEAKLAKNPQLTILKQALIKGESVKKEYEERQKMLSKAKKQGNSTNKDSEPEGKRWYCEVCPVNFATVDELRQHEKSHDADKPFICILCEKDFVLKSSLSRHILTSHGVDPTPLVESDKCLKKSVQESNNQQLSIVKEEIDIAKDNSSSPFSADNMENDDEEQENGNENMLEMETVFVCEICTRDFNDRASLWLHIRATHKEYAAFACGVCLKICQDNAQLLNHVNMYHGGSKLLMSEQRRYSCTICGRQHDSRKKLITHVSIHNVDPSYDPASFVQLNTNYYNENVNSNEGNDGLIMDCDEDSEKIDCYICCKSFPNEDHLIRHQRNAHKSEQMGTGEYPGGSPGQNGTGNRAQYHLFFVCELCGSSHPSKWERWLHVSSAHGNEATIRCERDDCGKIFATKTLRNEHAQHHQLQGSSPNTCEICGKLWGSRVDYWKHVMGVHADTVPLICGVCLKVFPDVMQLSQHVKLKHWPLTNGDFSCDICGRPYSNKSKMSRHRKIHGLDGEVYNPAATNSSLVINDAMSEMSSLPVSVQMDNGLPQPVDPASMDLNCEMCGDLKFPCLEDLCNHRRIAHNLFPCDLCNKCYGRTSHLWKHVNRVHKGHEDVTCRYCLKTSASKEHLAAHIAKIHRYEPEVKSEFKDTMNFKQSYNMAAAAAAAAAAAEEDGLHFCEKCNKSFHKRYLLRRHMKGCQNYRKDPGALLTRCRACERIFKDRASLQKHIENHHSSYECHLCKETITSKLGIMTHNRVHHMQHPDLTCELESCRKLFRTKEDLESHRKDHKHFGMPNVCDFCGDTVENKLKLKMHILSLHRNEIGVSCGVCLIPMKDPKDLKKHVEDVHASILQRPNTCQVCGKQYASKWKAFDHTKKCHGKVFRTCKQCLAVFTSDEDLRSHYEHVHNIPKDQLDAYQYRLEVSGVKMEDYDLGPLEVVVKEEPDELDFDVDAFDDDNGNSNDSKRRRSVTDTFDCEICPEIFLNHELLSSHYRNVHNTDPERMFKRVKLEFTTNKAKKKMRERENYECKNCQKQFCTKTLYLGHVNVCTRKSVSGPPTSILEAHLKNNNQVHQIKREEPEPIVCETNLNIPDFNLFEDINMQLSGQKPVPSLMPLGHSSKSAKYSRKDSRKVYDESTNTECTCEVCGKQWPAKKHLWQHLIRFHRAEAAVTCGVCLKLCATYDDLSEHLKNVHPAILSTAGNNFTCKICGRYHNARSKLLLHMSIHINCKNNFMCGRCNRSFENDEKLKEHIGTCLGVKEEQTTEADADSIAVKEENEEKGSLIGDEEDAPEENEYESEDNSDNGNSSSNDSDSNSSNSNSDSSSDNSDDDSSDDEDGRSRNIDEDSSNSKDSDNVDQVQVQQTAGKVDETETMSLGEEDEDEEDEDDDEEKPSRYGVMSESEEDEYLKQQQMQQQQQLQQHQMQQHQMQQHQMQQHQMQQQQMQQRYEMVQKEPMLVNYSDDEGPPALSPMLPMAIKQTINEQNEDSQEELRVHALGDSMNVKKEVAKSDDSDEDSSDDDAEDSEEGVVPQAEVVDPNAAFHVDNSRSSNEGEEEQDEGEMQEVEEEQEEGEEVEAEVEAEDEEEEGEVEEEQEQEQEHEEQEELEEVEEQEMQEVEEGEEEEVEHDMNEAEVLEVDENDMHNLNGTVLMLTNDADGNQILIQRNMSDLENDESVHDMAQYVFQDGTGFALEDYEAIVESQADEEDEEHQQHQHFEMEIGQEVEEHVQEEEAEEVEEEEVEAPMANDEEHSSSAKS